MLCQQPSQTDSKGIGSQRPAARLDQIDVAVDTVVDPPGMEDQAHLEAPGADQRDAPLADDGLRSDCLAACQKWSPRHASCGVIPRPAQTPGRRECCI